MVTAIPFASRNYPTTLEFFHLGDAFFSNIVLGSGFNMLTITFNPIHSMVHTQYPVITSIFTYILLWFLYCT